MRQLSVPALARFLAATTAIWAVITVVQSWTPPRPPPAPPRDPVQFWREYRDAARGFSLRTPPDWQAATTTDATLAVGFTTANTAGLIQRGRINPRYPYTLSVWVLPAVADHPLARGKELPIATVEDFFARVPTVATRGETIVDGQRAYRFIANEGHQYFGLLIPRGGAIYALHFERTWTDARFDAARTERAVLQSFRFTR